MAENRLQQIGFVLFAGRGRPPLVEGAEPFTDAFAEGAPDARQLHGDGRDGAPVLAGELIDGGLFPVTAVENVPLLRREPLHAGFQRLEGDLRRRVPATGSE